VPVRIVIPAIGVNAPVMQLGLNADRTIQVPPLAARNLAGWYKYGASPGQKGAAVIVGHIDSAAAGGEVFFRLRYMTKGERVYVMLADKRTEVFAVDGLQQVPKAAFPSASVYGPLKYAGLRLVTCGGAFNPATGSYESDVIVFAHLL
jgi:sortase (surface protein transpeptidase)